MSQANRPQQAQSSSSPSWYSVPAPVKRVFDYFPLKTYPPNAKPRQPGTASSSSSNPSKSRLYIFTDSLGARTDAPSFNPQCLKWQAYLKFSGIEHCTVPSNNHASPSGVLPFLIPAAPADPLKPVPAHKLQAWVKEQTHTEEAPEVSKSFDVYMSLIDDKIRRAWLYTLYLDPVNFGAVAKRLYVDQSTRNFLVRMCLAKKLQDAARAELLRTCTFIDVDDLEAEADNAFASLSTLLGDNQYFTNNENPGLFDASVFAYTQLLLDDELGLKHNPVGLILRKYENLVQHRERLLYKYF